MFMKKYVIVLFSALFMLVLSGNAQQPNNSQRPKSPSIENRVDKMATDLGLTELEKTALKELFVKQDADMKKFRETVNRESPDFKDKMKEMRKTQDDELKSVIGEEKFNKWQAIRAEMRKNAEQKPATPPVPPVQ